jgi:hypothetical protein
MLRERRFLRKKNEKLNKEISVSREIGRSLRFSKLKDGLSVLSKDELADSLAYNSIKV